MCDYFPATCSNENTGIVRHPALGLIPICEPCSRVVDRVYGGRVGRYVELCGLVPTIVVERGGSAAAVQLVTVATSWNMTPAAYWRALRSIYGIDEAIGQLAVTA
jgi:hypothetical protein